MRLLSSVIWQVHQGVQDLVFSGVGLNIDSIFVVIIPIKYSQRHVNLILIGPPNLP